jgi:predicted acetyltransferase
VVFAIRRESDGEDIGTAMVLVSNDRDAVMHVGHIGCDIRPEHRKHGHTIRLIRALASFLRERGVEDIVLACDVGHQSQYDSCVVAGAKFMGDTFGAEGGACGGARFILPAQAEGNPH